MPERAPAVATNAGPGAARRVAVTGGAGFIGHHLVARLVAEGREVTVIDDLSVGRREGLAPTARFLRLDVGDTDAVAAALAEVDAVAHLAAVASVERAHRMPLETHRANATGTLSVLEAARRAGVRGIVLAGSAAVYGASDRPVRESDPLTPSSLYGVDKRACEGYLSVYAALYGLGAITLRYFNVYGPGQLPGGGDAPVIARWLADLASGRPLELQGDGEQTRDFVYVGDVADATARALDLAAAGHVDVLNVGSGRATRLNALIGALGQLAGRPPALARMPVRPGDIRHSCADIGRARTVLGFAPATALPVGLGETWRFWQEPAAGASAAPPPAP